MKIKVLIGLIIVMVIIIGVFVGLYYLGEDENRAAQPETRGKSSSLPSASDALKQTIEIKGPDTIVFHFDNRSWKLGWQGPDPKNQLFNEYVISGETVENWTELVTIQMLPGVQKTIDAKSFAMEAISELGKKFGSEFSGTAYSNEDSADILVQWQVEGLGKNNGYEIARYFPGKNSLIIIHYASKSPISDQHRDAWVELLQAAKVVD